jgi:hypothetical protein
MMSAPPRPSEPVRPAEVKLDVAERTALERAAQGLPPTIESDDVHDQVVALLAFGTRPPSDSYSGRT